VLIALIENPNIIVPFSPGVKGIESFYKTAEVENVIEVVNDSVTVTKRRARVRHNLLLALREKRQPGLVLFSSGTTGKSKAAVHNFVLLLNKFRTKRHTFRTVAFLLFDHIGGLNTLFYSLSNCGTIVAPVQRSPESICRLIEKYKIELLPTSPSFLNMILMSRAYQAHDLSSLRLITYGTEVMPEQTLKRVSQLFPKVELKQTYGLSELGIMGTQSKGPDSLWLRVGGEDYETKIVNNTLYIKAKTAMLGYLNAPSPFDEVGWFNTHDKVDVDGDWIKILCRDTHIINVGGQKVYPAEVESVLMEIDNIAEVTVYGKANPIMGNVVAARIRLFNDEPLNSLKKKVRRYCRSKLESFKVPAFFEIATTSQVSDRFKKLR
jgi:acyl-coenzyme A synthetase/AMP-(fatty) acid ligase